jgi:hypothetical protein
MTEQLYFDATLVDGSNFLIELTMLKDGNTKRVLSWKGPIYALKGLHTMIGQTLDSKANLRRTVIFAN